MGLKLKADPVFFLSLVGVDKYGIVDDYEHIFDIYTRLYDFDSSEAVFKSAQDLFNFFDSKNKGRDNTMVDVYTLVEYFVKHHPNGNFVLDEVPFLANKKSECKLFY